MAQSDETAPKMPAIRDEDRPEPPRAYYAACGALCDVFWWARKQSPEDASAAGPSISAICDNSDDPKPR